MPRFILTTTLLLLFILEGTVLQVLSPASWGLSWLTVPRFALVGAIMVAMVMGRREGLYYGMALGFLQDVLYGQVIGVYTMSMLVAGYFAGLIVLLFQRSFGMVLVTVGAVLFGHEWLLYTMFRLFSASQLDVQWMLITQILPTVGVNLLFAALIYIPLNRLCEAVLSKRELPLD